ncbi:MAG TPA: hypothetical protein VD995_33750 [Azospirillum sp.]|nr:hypothetical protein [Azospirillum sp.]
MRLAPRLLPAAVLAVAFLLPGVAPSVAVAQERPAAGAAGAKPVSPLLDFAADIDDCPVPGAEELAAISLADRRTLPNPFQADQDRWINTYLTWHYVGLFFTIASVVLGAIAASSLVADGAKFKVKSFTALLATIVSATLGVLKPDEVANRHLSGWIYMDSAITLFKTDKRVTECHIGRAFARAESLVNKNIIGAALGADR